MSSTETLPQRHLSDGMRTALGIAGLVAVLLGLLIIIFPAQSGSVVMQIIAAIMAAYALVAGAVYLGMSFFGKSLGGWARVGNILLGVLYLVGGIVMMANLGAAAAVLAILLSVTVGVLWLLEGALALTLLKASPNRVWTIIYAVVSLVAGAVLLLSPLLGAVTLWLLLGVSMLVMGIVQVVRAVSSRSRA